MAKILWLAPTQIMIETVTSFLRIHGHEVVGVDRISRATEELSNDRFDLLVCQGYIDQNHDGANFALQCQRQFTREHWRTKVAIYSRYDEHQRPDVPFFLAVDAQKLPEEIAALLAQKPPTPEGVTHGTHA